MKPLTPEEKALLAELREKEAAYVRATQETANTLARMILTGDGDIDHCKVVENAKQIRLLLEPYDEAPVMLGEFVPSPRPGEVVEIPYPYDRVHFNVTPKPAATACYRRADSPTHEWVAVGGTLSGKDGKKSTMWKCTCCGAASETFA